MDITTVFVAILILAGLASFLNSPAFIGRAGEKRIARRLRRGLDAEDYLIFNDLIIPARGGTTQIDHIVLSRFGIFVIETKNMSGWIFGDEHQANWTQVFPRKKIRFQNPLRQNYKHTKALAKLFDTPENSLSSLVVFAGSARPKTKFPAQVFWNARHLTQFIAKQSTLAFSQEQIRDFATILSEPGFEGSRASARAHRKSLQASLKARKDPTRCPKCGDDLIKRTSRRSGQTFLGCATYPTCRGTRPCN